MNTFIKKSISFAKIIFISAVGLSIFLTSCSEKITVNEQSLTDGWKISSSEEISSDGKSLTTTGIDGNKWVSATVPTTVMGALVDAGIYKDIFFGDNLDKIPTELFEKSWWFRKEFAIDNFNPDAEQLRLFVDGINYRANIWLNGTQIASQDTLFGAFRQFEIDITNTAKASNILAFEILPPQPRDFYMGFVDWAPTPPDKYMGIYREVRVKRTGKVAIDFPFVQTDVNTETLNEARITISSQISNFSEKPKNVIVAGEIEGIKLSQEFQLKPGEQKTIWFKPENFNQLIVKNPRLWWPNGLGNPDMYTLNLKVYDGKTLVDNQKVDFGIRTIETYLNDSGVRGYKVNGRDLLQKSGGWVDDLFLRFMPEKDAAQIRYVKEMNMNALRFEGVWGNNHHIYDLCDRNGILLMVGWSCQW